MNEVIQCPPESVLNELLHRRLGESHVQLLDEHFEQCESCQRRLDCLTPSLETVVEGQTEDTLSEGEQGILQNLIDHLRDHPPEEIGGDSRAGWPTADLRSRSSGTVRFSHDGRVGHYCLVEELGSGASGRLFRAIDERLDRSVALKILRESQMESVEGRVRLEREARAAARLEHDHIVRIYDVSLTDGDPPYIAYELIEGESLSERVHRGGLFIALPGSEDCPPGRTCSQRGTPGGVGTSGCKTVEYFYWNHRPDGPRLLILDWPDSMNSKPV